MTETSYLGLKKPDPQDYYDVGDWNDNSDTIDQFAEGLAGDGGVLQQMQSAIAALAGGVRLKGAVNYYTDLPATGQSEGDAYTVLYSGTSGTAPLGVEYAWATYNNTAQWVPLGVDPTYYAKAADLAAEVTARQAADAEQTAAIADAINRGSKNLLDTWAAPAQTQPINGITWAVNPDDGTITATGTASGNSFFYLTANPANLAYGVETILTGCPAGGSGTTWEVQCAQIGSTARSDYGEGTIQPASYVYRYVVCCVRSGQTVNGLMFKPMVCSTAAYKATRDYEPYAPSNAELYKLIREMQT